MKPKLWNGPNALGEGLVRGLELTGSPYLSAEAGSVRAGVMDGKGEVKFGEVGDFGGFIVLPADGNAQYGWTKDAAGNEIPAGSYPLAGDGAKADAYLATGKKKAKVNLHTELRAKHVSWIGDYKTVGACDLMITYDHGLSSRYKLAKYSQGTAYGEPDICMRGSVIRTGGLGVIGAAVFRDTTDGVTRRWFIIASHPSAGATNIVRFYCTPFIPSLRKSKTPKDIDPVWTQCGEYIIGGSLDMKGPWFFSHDGREAKTVAYPALAPTPPSTWYLESTPETFIGSPYEIPTTVITAAVAWSAEHGVEVTVSSAAGESVPSDGTNVAHLTNPAWIQYDLVQWDYVVSGPGLAATTVSSYAAATALAQAAAGGGWIPTVPPAVLGGYDPATTIALCGYPHTGAANGSGNATFSTGGIGTYGLDLRGYYVTSPGSKSGSGQYSVEQKALLSLSGEFTYDAYTKVTGLGKELIAVDYALDGSELPVFKEAVVDGTRGLLSLHQSISGTVYGTSAVNVTAHSDVHQSGTLVKQLHGISFLGADGVGYSETLRVVSDGAGETVNAVSVGSTWRFSGPGSVQTENTKILQGNTVLDVDARFKVGLVERAEVTETLAGATGYRWGLVLQRMDGGAVLNTWLIDYPQAESVCDQVSSPAGPSFRTYRELAVGNLKATLAIRKETPLKGEPGDVISIVCSAYPQYASPNTQKYNTYWAGAIASLPDEWQYASHAVLRNNTKAVGPLFDTPSQDDFRILPVRPL